MTRNAIEIDRILCPTDFSVFSARALGHAIALAQRFQARLTVLHVLPPTLTYGGVPPYSPALAVVPPPLREQVEGELRAFIEPAVAARVPTQIDLREGNPWREIERAAEELPADFVVMGTHGYGGFEHLLLGSVAEKLLRRLPCPVLTICHEEGRTWEAPGLVRRILCATDLSDSSPATIAWALALAERHQAEVTLLHVVDSLPDPTEHVYMAVPDIGPLRRDLEQRARVQLHEAVPEEARGDSAITECVTLGRAYKEILRIAAEQNADMIVMGTRGHSPIGRMFFGSTSHHVVRAASCPVVTIRPARATARPPSETRELAVAVRRDT
jgi:nucleotide-binding universal stress UspA family protein